MTSRDGRGVVDGIGRKKEKKKRKEKKNKGLRGKERRFDLIV